ERDHRTSNGACSRLAIGCGRRQRTCRQRDGRRTAVHVTANFAFNVVSKFERTGLGEEDTVRRPQAAHLAFVIRSEVRVFSALVDEAVPDIDVDNTRAFGARPVEIVEINRIGRRFGTAERRQADPDHGHALALHRIDRFIDALGINFRPLIGAEFDCAAGLLRRLRLRLRSGSLFLFGVLFFILAILFGRRLFGLVLLAFRVVAFFLVGLLWDFALANARTIADAHHHHDVVGFLLREDIAGNTPPVEIAFGLVSHQTRVKLVFADDRDFRGIRERIFEPVAKPIGHGVAKNDDRRRRRDRLGFRVGLAWRGSTRIVYRRLLLWILIAAAEEATEETVISA